MLVYLGVSAWRHARREDDDGEFGTALAARLSSGRTPGAAFRASLVTIAANPELGQGRARWCLSRLVVFWNQSVT